MATVLFNATAPGKALFPLVYYSGDMTYLIPLTAIIVAGDDRNIGVEVSDSVNEGNNVVSTPVKVTMSVLPLNTCSLCPVGWYSASEGSATCTICPAAYLLAGVTSGSPGLGTDSSALCYSCINIAGYVPYPCCYGFGCTGNGCECP